MSRVFGAIGGAFKSGGIMLHCLSRQKLRVTVTDGVTGAPVRDARIVATGTGWSRSGTTGANGVKEFVVYPGTYTVTAAKDWFLPEPATSAATAVAAGATVNIGLNISELRFYLQVDADRDGVVDNAWTADPDWTWGVNGSGAIMLCNCDDDDVPLKNAGDNTDGVVNANNDNTELAPLDIVRHGTVAAPPAHWTARLHVDPGDEAHVRIFATRAAGAAEVIPAGGAHAHVHDIGALNVGGGGGYQGAQMGMEAIHYAGLNFPEGEVTVWLTVTKNALAGGTVSYATGAKVRVAPWLLPSHLEDATSVYVANLGPDVIGGGRLQGGNATFRNTLNGLVVPAGCNLVPMPAGVAGNRWVQDRMELGWSVLPGNPLPQRMDVVLEAIHNGGHGAFIRGLRGADFGHITVHTGGGHGTNFDGFGNLEVTPPVRDTDGNDYPWGRLIYGPGNPAQNDDMDPGTLAFLRAQVVQRPIEVDTTWLEVGHIDEVLTFLPRPAGAAFKQWRLLVASPRRAYQLLAGIAGTTQMLRGRTIPMRDGLGAIVEQLLQQSVANFLTGNTLIADPDMVLAGMPGTINGAVLRTWNLNMVQPQIDGIVNVLRDDISLVPADLIEVPVIFYPKVVQWDPVSADPDDLPDHSAAALTGDMPNMLVINNHCIVPRPFGPHPAAGHDHFETDLRNSIANRVGHHITVSFIDDWYAYHIQDGEVHCGTNTLRQPANLNAWLGSNPARWWEYEPPQ